LSVGVAVGVPPAVEGVRLAARIGSLISKRMEWSAGSAGRDAPALRRARTPAATDNSWMHGGLQSAKSVKFPA
jgi:hypothetical protein